MNKTNDKASLITATSLLRYLSHILDIELLIMFSVFFLNFEMHHETYHFLKVISDLYSWVRRQIQRYVSQIIQRMETP